MSTPHLSSDKKNKRYKLSFVKIYLRACFDMLFARADILRLIGAGSRYIEIKKLEIRNWGRKFYRALARVSDTLVSVRALKRPKPDLKVGRKSISQFLDFSALLGTSFLISILFLVSCFWVIPRSARAASYVTGRFGKAISFDGSGDYVDMGDVSSTVKTVDFWVSPNTTTQKFLELNGSAYIDATSGTVAATGFTSPTIYVDGVVSSTLTTGWHHIAVTTGTGINGNSVIVGKIATTYFTGLIDSVRMYDRALSASEIAAHYSLGRGKHDNYAAKIKLAADDSNSYLDESLTNGQDYLASFWYHPGEDNGNAIRFKVSGLADPIMAEHNLMASSTMGLVGAWNFEEDPTGTDPVVKDLSGNGNNGTTSYVTADWVAGDRVAGKYGYAYDFNGSTDGRYVEIGDTGIAGDRDTVTYAMWINNGGAAINQVPFSDRKVDNTDFTVAIYVDTGNIVKAHIYELAIRQIGTVNIETGSWHYVVYVINQTTDTRYLYIDGELDVSDNYTGTGNFNYTRYSIGRGGNSGGYFNGTIDSVRIYNRALTASEVYDRYKAGDWHKYELSFEADQTGAHLFKFIQDGATSGNSIVYVDNFRVDKNLAEDGGMESAEAGTDPYRPTDWSFTTDSPEATESDVDSTVFHTGSNSFELINADDGEGIKQTITVESGKWYTLSIYGKNDNQDVEAVISGAATDTIDLTTANNAWYKSNKTYKSNSTSLTVQIQSGATDQDGYFDDISVVELDSTSTYTDPTTTTPSSEANSYTTGKWSGTQAAFLMDGADKLSYSAGGIIPNDAGVISMWWKPMWDYSVYEEDAYLFNAEDATNKFLRFYFDASEDKFVANFYNGSNWTAVTATSSALTFAEDAWQHIGVIYGNDEGTVRILVDGAESGESYTGAAWTEQTTPTNFYVGSLYGASANTNQAEGWFDDIRIYGDALATSTVNAIYAITPDAPTNATWKFNLADPIIDD